MTVRALLIGFALGLLVSAFTFFNDAVIEQTDFISNHLPISVFGAISLFLVALNPLLRVFGRRMPLNVSEVAVIAAVGLAACGWPSFSFYWGFAANVATPSHWAKSEPAWQAHHVMSYVPGASREVGHGHVRDWASIVDAVVADGADEGDSIPAQLWQHLTGRERDVMRRVVEHDAAKVDSQYGDQLTSILNRLIREAPLQPPADLNTADWPADVAALVERQGASAMSSLERTWVNRWMLVTAFPERVLPPPQGSGVLVAGRPGAPDAVNRLMAGGSIQGQSMFEQVPWGVWWPTLALWGGLALLLGVASLCLALIVHPQWSRRELLTYPLAQFVSQFSQRDEERPLPKVAYQQVFWWGLGLTMGLHLLNGLHAWFPQVPEIPLQMELGPLKELFPNASRVYASQGLFRPYIYLSVIAFAFFLNTSVSFSVGISTFLFVAVGAMVIGAGLPMEHEYLGATPMNLLRFGSFAGMAVMIFYAGRRYYSRVVSGMAGLSRSAEVPGYAVWAGRVLIVCSVLAVVVLCQAGLDWVLASLFVALVLLTFLIMSRIVCETGLFFVQPWWMPVAVLTALFGIEAIGPTSYIVLALASIIIVGDPRTTVMPYISNGLQMVERSSPQNTRRIGWPMLAILVVGFFVAGMMALGLVHDRGVLVTDEWAARRLPQLPFNHLASYLADMHARRSLVEATANDGLANLASLQLSFHACLWVGLGVVLILVTALGRLRLPWWPIHPVLFLVWGTTPVQRLAVSFLIGWAIKGAVIQTVGARGYHQLVPLMIGVIAGELLIGLIWIGVGTIYYVNTGMSPPTYSIYP